MSARPERRVNMADLHARPTAAAREATMITAGTWGDGKECVTVRELTTGFLEVL